MSAHDVIVECEKFSLDLTDRCANESCFFTSSFRSRSGTTNSSLHGKLNKSLKVTIFQYSTCAVLAETSSLHALKCTATFFSNEMEFFSPSTILSPTPPVTETIAANMQLLQVII